MNKKLTQIILIIFIVTTAVFAQEKVKIKFATLAPEGSTWMNVMKEFSQSLKEKSNGSINFKIYPGGIQGDEKDVIRKMRIGQLHSGGFTGVGLGVILPEVRILDTPFLYKSKEEVDFIADKFFDRFAAGFEKKGYVLLGWAEVGWVYIYTNKPVNAESEMNGVKMWMWEGDPVSRATFSAFDVSPIPLSITDVLTSLQTGLIDGVYTSPLGAVVLQWFTKVKYVLDIPMANSTGAILITKKKFDKLSPDQQKILKEEGRKFFGKLTKLSREDNLKSQKTMYDYGMQKTVVTDPKLLAEFDTLGKEARQSLVGELYDQKLLDDVEHALEEFRKK
jgi:TRAP-type transport system periplasmic protein